jgi:hypothetical protein
LLLTFIVGDFRQRKYLRWRVSALRHFGFAQCTASLNSRTACRLRQQSISWLSAILLRLEVIVETNGSGIFIPVNHLMQDLRMAKEYNYIPELGNHGRTSRAVL